MTTKTFNACIVCSKPIEFFGPDDCLSKGATTFAGSPGFGSRFDGIPGVPMQVIVCDDCLEHRRERVAVVRRTRQRDIVEYFDWDPTEEDGIRKNPPGGPNDPRGPLTGSPLDELTHGEP